MLNVQIYYLANHTEAVSLGTSNTFTYSSNCSSTESINILEQYCYRTKAEHLTEILFVRQYALHSYISNYHIDDRHHVPATSFDRWLNSSSIDPGAKGAIHGNTIMAILQHLIDTKIL